MLHELEVGDVDEFTVVTLRAAQSMSLRPASQALGWAHLPRPLLDFASRILVLDA